MLNLRILAFLVLSSGVAVAADVETVPVHVEVTVDAAQLDSGGRFTLEFSFRAEEQLARPYRIRVGVFCGGDEILWRDHAAPTPPNRWPVGETVRYELPSLFPMHLVTEDLPPALEVYVGFHDLGEDEHFLPLGDGKKWNALRHVATFAAPTVTAGLSPEAEASAIADAEQLAEAGDVPTAWEVLERALRRSDDYVQKVRLREAMEDLGHFAPRPLTTEEEGIAADRIFREKVRTMRELAGRMHRDGQLCGALEILEQCGGMLSEDEHAPVIGSLDEANRVTRDADNLRDRLLRAAVEKDTGVVDMGSLPRWEKAEELRKYVMGLARKGRRGAAYDVVGRAEFSRVDAVREEALRLKDEVKELIFGDVTPEERARIDAGWNHPAWGRIHVAASHEFIYIGPRKLVEGIVRNRESTRRFDLAYIFQTDLFGRTPNPGGDRITVFFKELWDFGGGVGGGKIIDIGSADPGNDDVGVDNGLLYHELTHCVYDLVPGYPAFTEGIADFGACFSHDVLGQKAAQAHSVKHALERFEEDYLNRDIAFWRMSNYAPCAGFFLHFIHTYGRDGKRYRWSLYRRFFHEYDDTPVRDGRVRGVVRAFAFYLVRAFGQDAFDDLMRFRFPLVESDREALRDEIDAGDDDVPAWAEDAAGMERVPNSPRHRDRLYRKVARMRRDGSRSAVQNFCEGKLGVIYDWRLVGPFRANNGQSFSELFAPELGVIDFAARYEHGQHTAVWHEPATEKGTYATLQKDGWIAMDYPYPENVSAYAYLRVTVPEPRSALLHLRADDKLTVWHDWKFLEKMPDLGNRGGSRRPERMPDETSVPLELHAGVNVLLVKVTNGRGAMGFVAALTDAVGRVMGDVEFDTDKPPAELLPPQTEVPHRFKQRVLIEGRKLSQLKATVGRFKVQSRNKTKALVGTDTEGRVQWRKYTVRPGFPKDSPSNLGWLPKSLTKELTDFQLGLDLEMQGERLPKMTVTFDGEGNEDGLAGWTLLFVPRGDKLQVRLEKYDNLFFSTWNVEIPPQASYRLEIRRVDEHLTVTFADRELFPRIHVPPIANPDSRRIGFATWGPEVGLSQIRFQR